MFSMQCRKNTAVGDNKKKKEYSKLYEYMYKYIPILNVTRKTQNKNDSINSVLQHGRVFDNNCFVYFLLQDFPI